MCPSAAGMTRDRAFCSKVLQYKRSNYGPDSCSEEIIQNVIRQWDLCPEMEERLRNLVERVQDVNHFKRDPHILVRFLHAPWGHKEAELMFRRMIDWRRQNHVDTILDDYVPPQLLLDAIPAAILKDYDREGDPIYVERGGAVDATGLLRVFTKEELIRYFIWTRERNSDGVWINDFERRRGRKPKALTIIYDLKGLSSRHLNSKSIEYFKEIMRINQVYYPGPIKKVFFIRAPKIFQLVWSIVRHLFPLSAQQKMIFCGANYLDVLDKYLDINALPRSIFAGGSGDVAVGMMQHLDGLESLPADYSEPADLPKHSTAETDEESITSNESFHTSLCSPVEVSGKVILRGSWKKGKQENVEVTRML